jgi:hypothetical protein
MPIDLWYLSKRGPDKKRLPSKRHGRGRRYRVRYQDAHGVQREKLFDLKRDAEEWELQVRTRPVAENTVDQSERLRTFREYGERWRLSREVGWALETRKRVESNLRCHLYPQFGDRPLRTDAGQGCRLGELLGMEDGTRCVESANDELHVAQQLRYSPREYDGFYLCEPKAGSAGTVDLDPVLAEKLAEHVRQFPPVGVELVDVTSGEPVRRVVQRSRVLSASVGVSR